VDEAACHGATLSDGTQSGAAGPDRRGAAERVDPSLHERDFGSSEGRLAAAVDDVPWEQIGNCSVTRLELG
jgi:hypothetical protein